MRKHLKIGLVVPFATDKVPVEGPLLVVARDDILAQLRTNFFY